MFEDLRIGDHERRRSIGMELLRRIFSRLGLDCLKRAPSSTQSPPATKKAEPEPPHCQGCVAFDVHLKRLNCGHLFCDPCADRIVNQAFQDIEGLSEFPCPVCQSVRRLSSSTLAPQLELNRTRPATPLQSEVIREEEEQEVEKEVKDGEEEEKEEDGVPGD